MSETAIRAKIKSIMDTVTDIGKVHDYERWTADWSQFLNLFKANIGGKDQIRGWEILRKSAPAEYIDNVEEMTKHLFIVRGYMGVQDASATEKTFNVLIEAVRAKFRFNFTLDGLCELAGPVSVDLVEVRSFGGTLCHYCELSLPAQELFT